MQEYASVDARCEANAYRTIAALVYRRSPGIRAGTAMVSVAWRDQYDFAGEESVDERAWIWSVTITRRVP